MAGVILILSVFVLGAGGVFVAYYMFTKMPGLMLQRKLDARLDEVVRPLDEEPKEGAGLVKTSHSGALPAFERLLAGSSRGSAIAMWIEQSGVKTSISSLFVMALVSALICGFIVAALLRMSVGWIGGGMVGFAIPFLILKMKRTRRLRAFEEAVSRGARPDVPRAQGGPRVCDRPEDGRRRNAGADRPRVQEDLR